jgi:hypothetical protein
MFFFCFFFILFFFLYPTKGCLYFFYKLSFIGYADFGKKRRLVSIAVFILRLISFFGIFISTMCFIFVNIHIVLFSMYTYSFEYTYYFYP